MRTAGQGPSGFEKREGFMKAGQELIMAGFAGLAGTRSIWEYKREELETRFPPIFLDTLEQGTGYSVKQWMEHELLQKNGSVTAWEYAGEGGVLAALWNLSGIYSVGFTVDLRAMPIRQITVEVCELYGLNPYRLLSCNCVLMSADRGGQTVKRLEAEGIPSAVIGQVDRGITRQIRREEGAGCLERPKPDELLKIRTM